MGTSDSSNKRKITKRGVKKKVEKLKMWVAKTISKTILAYLVLISKYKRKHKSLKKTLIFTIQVVKNFYVPSKKLSKGRRSKEVIKSCKNRNQFTRKICV